MREKRIREGRESAHKEDCMNFEKITKYLDSLPETYGLPSVDVIIMKDHEQVYRHMAGTTDTGRHRACRACNG